MGKMTLPEKEFVLNYFIHSNWRFEPIRFHLAGTTYTPDFYDKERDVFIEVVGNSTAYNSNKNKYILFKKTFPQITFEIRKYTGRLLRFNGDRLVWMDENEVEPGIDILIRDVDRQEWQHFQGYCRFEGVTATAKIKEIIAKYIKKQGKG